MLCQSHNMRGVLRIPAPSSVLHALSKPQHARSPTDSSSQHDFASSIKATTCAEPCGFQLPAAFCKPAQSHNMRGVLRILAPSSILQAPSEPQHARSPTDSSSQQHFGSLVKITSFAESYGFQLVAVFSMPCQSHNMRGVLRIPAPSSILRALSKPQHARSPTDSSSQQHFASSILGTTCAESYGFQLPAAFCKLQLNQSMRGVLRIPAPSSILQTLLK